MRKVFVLAVVTAGILVNTQSGSAEDLLRYREYVLGSSIADVARTSGTAATEARTTHERPARIQTLKWRAPYRAYDTVGGDPVRDIVFNFVDDALYRIVVTYDNTRVEGLTDEDLLDALSPSYGEPAVVSKGIGEQSVSPGLELPSQTVAIARWETEVSSVMLTRTMFSSGVQLVLTSKPLYTVASAAIREAVRLDTSEAPQREIDARTRQIAAAAAAQAKARAANKATFRP